MNDITILLVGILIGIIFTCIINFLDVIAKSYAQKLIKKYGLEHYENRK